MAISVAASTLDDLLRKTYSEILDSGVRLTASRGDTHEVVGAMLELENPRARLSRSATRRRLCSALAELCWYLSGSNQPDQIVHYIPIYSKEVEEDGTINGAYGPRIYGTGANAQIENAVKALNANPSTRRAVVQIFDKSDVFSEKRFKDIPCTNTIQFLIRMDKLDMVVNMRSNDAYLGLPHDVFVFTMIQELVSRELGVELGKYVHMVGSLHLYELNRDSVEDFIGEGWQSTDGAMPPMPPDSQSAQVAQFIKAEKASRENLEYGSYAIPTESYWANLARIFIYREKKANGDALGASRVRDDIDDLSLKEFLA